MTRHKANAPDPEHGSGAARRPEPRSGKAEIDLGAGVAAIRDAARTLPGDPGVYRMLAADGSVLYVGKARNLKRRVIQYTQIARQPTRLQRMVAETRSMEFAQTTSEVEALLLESNLIKRLRPRYNVLLRDDKTFPHIVITADHDFPLLTKHRGAKNRSGDYFGPFASAGAVNRTITALQRAFLLRNCSDSVFASRSRPCLQYQIKRCTAPCVGYADEAGYGEQVSHAKAFLAGKSSDVRARFADEMMAASEALDFETAARWRDRIRALTAIQAHQDINLDGVVDDADVIAQHEDGGQVSIQVVFFRGGRNYGNRAYFPSHDRTMEPAAVLAAFITQFYDDKPAPKLILLSLSPDERALIEEALAIRAGHKVDLSVPQRGDKKRLVDNATMNAREALGRRLAESASQNKLLAGVAEVMGLEAPPERIEIYDNSHIQGTNALGAMVVATPEGFQKNAYRRFTIKTEGIAGDDYAMMREVLTRRFSRAQTEDPDRTAWPDLVLIDGGHGQLNAALAVMTELGIADEVTLCSIAKGHDREAGREHLYLPGRKPFRLEPRSPVLYFLQRLRDEAHRFAIGGHRQKRAKQIEASPLDDIPGIGPRRKKALLHHFGSARAVSRAGLADLESVEGISTAVARTIYDHFRAA